VNSAARSDASEDGLLLQRTIDPLVENKEIPQQRYGTGRGTIRNRCCDRLEYSKKQTIPAKSPAITLEQQLNS
jgi:hypothetical protein